MVGESMERRERARNAEFLRARLLALVEKAAETVPEDGARLRAAVAAAPDPAPLAAAVQEALARPDCLRNPGAVARKTAAALREIGCGVGEEF